MKTVVIEHVVKLEIMKYGLYREILNIWVGWIAAVIYLDKPYALNLLISKTAGRPVITEKSCPPQMGTTTSGIGVVEESGLIRDRREVRGVHDLDCTWKSRLHVLC